MIPRERIDFQLLPNAFTVRGGSEGAAYNIGARKYKDSDGLWLRLEITVKVHGDYAGPTVSYSNVMVLSPEMAGQIVGKLMQQFEKDSAFIAGIAQGAADDPGI